MADEDDGRPARTEGRPEVWAVRVCACVCVCVCTCACVCARVHASTSVNSPRSPRFSPAFLEPSRRLSTHREVAPRLGPTGGTPSPGDTVHLGGARGTCHPAWADAPRPPRFTPDTCESHEEQRKPSGCHGRRCRRPGGERVAGQEGRSERTLSLRPPVAGRHPPPRAPHAGGLPWRTCPSPTAPAPPGGAGRGSNWPDTWSQQSAESRSIPRPTRRSRRGGGSDAGPPLRCPWTGCRASPARRRTELSGGSGGAGLWEERLSSCLGPTPQPDPSQDVLTLT